MISKVSESRYMILDDEWMHVLVDNLPTLEAAKRREAVLQAEREQNCEGHVASERDPKVCGRCGLHIDSLR